MIYLKIRYTKQFAKGVNRIALIGKQTLQNIAKHCFSSWQHFSSLHLYKVYLLHVKQLSKLLPVQHEAQGKF